MKEKFLVNFTFETSKKLTLKEVEELIKNNISIDINKLSIVKENGKVEHEKLIKYLDETYDKEELTSNVARVINKTTPTNEKNI